MSMPRGFNISRDVIANQSGIQTIKKIFQKEGNERKDQSVDVCCL